MKDVIAEKSSQFESLVADLDSKSGQMSKLNQEKELLAQKIKRFEIEIILSLFRSSALFEKILTPKKS